MLCLLGDYVLIQPVLQNTIQLNSVLLFIKKLAFDGFYPLLLRTASELN